VFTLFFSSELFKCSTKAGAIKSLEALSLVQGGGLPMTGVNFQINRSPTQPRGNPDKLSDQKGADASLSKFRKHIQLFEPTTRAAVLDPEKSAAECDTNGSSILPNRHQHKAQLAIVSDLFDYRSHLAQTGTQLMLAQLAAKQINRSINFLRFQQPNFWNKLFSHA
jgi:hypothetical protein